jgi:hypothetical protein
LICFQYFYSITIGCLIGSILTMALNYNIYDFFLHGISWIMIWTLWCYFAAYTAYWPPGYFCIICYYLKLQLNSIKIRLKVFILRANRLSLKERSLILKSILNEHNLLCQQIKSFNKYWKKYLTIKLILFVLIICFLSYLIFMKSMKWFASLQFLIVMSAHLLLIFIITYSASEIPHSNSLIAKDLQLISAKIKLHLSNKLKVCYISRKSLQKF